MERLKINESKQVRKQEVVRRQMPYQRIRRDHPNAKLESITYRFQAYTGGQIGNTFRVNDADIIFIQTNESIFKRNDSKVTFMITYPE